MRTCAVMGTSAADALAHARSGRVLTVFCDDVVLARRQLSAATEELESVPTLVALEWEHAPSLARELDEICDALAGAAASLWPNWYITAEHRFNQTRSANLEASAVVAEATRLSRGVSASWLRQTWEFCRQGKPPAVTNMAAAEQVRQLSLALDPTRLVLALSVARREATRARVRGLGRAAEWLAHEAKAKTLLLVPAAWQGDPELDHVSYRALTLQTHETLPEGLPELSRSLSEAGTSPSTQSDTPGPNVLVGPIVGKPHPGSEVERLVCQRIEADAELCELFQYNQRLTAVGKKHYIVDLVWEPGGLIVELDGPEHHSHIAYVKDRDRDYRLYLSGYTTLRIPNAEVYVSVETVIEKIRTMVDYLKARPPQREQEQ